MRPSGAIGGGSWRIDESSRRTKIRGTPVCGPAPVRNCVSVAPEGCWIVNEILVGVAGRIVPVGLKSTIWNVLAGAIVGTAGPAADEPQPASTSAVSASRETRG